MADSENTLKELEMQGFHGTEDWALAELGPWMLWAPTFSLVCQLVSGRRPAPQA